MMGSSVVRASLTSGSQSLLDAPVREVTWG